MGDAVGADYNAGYGTIGAALRGKGDGAAAWAAGSKADGVARGTRPVESAGRAFAKAKYVSVGTGTGTQGAGKRRRRRNGWLCTRGSDGTADRVEAEGSVILKSGDGETVTAPRGEVVLSAENQPQSAVMSGGVQFGTDEPLRHAKGGAAEGQVTFDKAGRLKHVVLTGGVHLNERLKKCRLQKCRCLE